MPSFAFPRPLIDGLISADRCRRMHNPPFPLRAGSELAKHCAFFLLRARSNTWVQNFLVSSALLLAHLLVHLCHDHPSSLAPIFLLASLVLSLRTLCRERERDRATLKLLSTSLLLSVFGASSASSDLFVHSSTMLLWSLSLNRTLLLFVFSATDAPCCTSAHAKILHTYFTRVSFSCALGTFAAWSAWRHYAPASTPVNPVERALSVLLVSCPCSIVLARPLLLVATKSHFRARGARVLNAFLIEAVEGSGCIVRGSGRCMLYAHGSPVVEVGESDVAGAVHAASLLRRYLKASLV